MNAHVPDISLTKKGEAYAAHAAANFTAASIVNLTFNPHDRLQLSTTIEQLINMLDDLSPDPDLEDGNDDEPYIGWPERGPAAIDRSHVQDDREADNADDEESDFGEANGDDEPWLGGMGTYCDGGLQYDLEADGPDGGTYVDAEPSLGATSEFNQDHAWAHVDLSMSDGEGEQECEDEGAQCDDEGVLELV